MIFFNHGIEGPKIDQAMEASAAGKAALIVGDTMTAQEQYKIAGERLEQHLTMLTRRKDIELTRFLAASSYYAGGHYERARRLSKDIHEFMLPPEVRPVFIQFKLDVKERSAPGYSKEMQNRLLVLEKKGDHGSIIKELQDHPFIMDRADVAFIRATSCERLGDHRAAALFWAHALKWKPNDPLLMVTSFPVRLNQNPLDLTEAWKAVQELVDVIPNPMTHAGAVFVKFHLMRGTTSDDERRLHASDLIRHFEAAWNLFQELPENFKSTRELREMMTKICYGAAWTYDWILHVPEKAAELREMAINLNPTSPLHDKLATHQEPTNGQTDETQGHDDESEKSVRQFETLSKEFGRFSHVGMESLILQQKEPPARSVLAVP